MHFTCLPFYNWMEKWYIFKFSPLLLSMGNNNVFVKVVSSSSNEKDGKGASSRRTRHSFCCSQLHFLLIIPFFYSSNFGMEWTSNRSSNNNDKAYNDACKVMLALPCDSIPVNFVSNKNNGCVKQRNLFGAKERIIALVVDAKNNW